MPVITQTAGHATMGRDIVISLIGGATKFNSISQETSIGLVTEITNVVSFEYNQEVIDITQTKLDSTTIVADIPRMWRGAIEFSRADANIDSLVDQIERSWYVDGVYNNGSMTVTIIDPLGGDTVMNFIDVAVRFENSQSSGERLTNVRIAFRAAQRILAAALLV